MTNSAARICVNNREMNGYDDSDFFSTFLIEGTDQFEEIMMGSTRFAGGTYFTEINASDEVKEMYSDWLSVQASIRESHIPRVGKLCTVARSRKYKDMVGRIHSIDKSQYDSRVTVAVVVFPDHYSTTVPIERIILEKV